MMKKLIIIMFFVCLISLFVLKANNVSASDDFEEESEYVLYKGRLTYNNGATNKYGQPWPDLMDFDKDGDIDFADRQIQYILVHNPDALDTPEGFMLVMVSVLTAFIGLGGGIAFNIFSGTLSKAGSNFNYEFSDELDDSNKENNSNLSSINNSSTTEKDEQVDLGPYIKIDEEGDLKVIDPATNEERLYVSNGDGTYSNPLTGATYSLNELKDSLDSRKENINVIQEDENTKQDSINSQREENQKRSKFGEEITEESNKKLAEEFREIEHDSYVENLEIKYGEEGKELKKAIMQEQINAEVESNEHMADEAYLAAGQKTAESTEKAADIAIDVLAEVTGEEGKAIKDAYTFTKSTLSRGAEAYAEGKSITKGMVHGALEGAINVGQNRADGATEKMIANVAGDMTKTALEATAKGEKVDFMKVVESGGMAAINTSIDVGLDLVGESAKEALDLGDGVIGNVFSTEITEKAVADGIKAGASDALKEGSEKIFKVEDEKD